MPLAWWQYALDVIILLVNAAAIIAPLFERPPPSDLQTLDRRRVEAIKKRLP